MWKNLPYFIFVLSLLVGNSIALGQKIQELDLGNCWASSNETEFKFSHFPSKSSEVLSRSKIKYIFESNFEKKANSEIEEFSGMGFFCNQFSKNLVGTITTGEGQFCLWMTSDGKGSWKLEEVLGAESPGDYCSGYDLGMIIVSGESTYLEKFLDKMVNEYPEVINGIERISVSSFRILLNDEFKLKEVSIISLLKEKDERSILAFDLNLRHRPNGDFFKINL